jgi:hypothetical protein
VNAHVDLQIIRLPEYGTTALAPNARQPATCHPLGAFFAAVKIGVGNRRLIRRLGGGGTGVNASFVPLQLAHPLEAFAADGAGIDDARGVSLYVLSIFPLLRIVVVVFFFYKRRTIKVVIIFV